MIQGTASTTNTTFTTALTFTTASDQTQLVRVLVVGRRTGGTAGSTDDSYAAYRTTTIKNVGGTVTVDTPNSDYTYKDVTGAGHWNCQFIVSGTSVLFQVQGQTNNNVSWTAMAQILTL